MSTTDPLDEEATGMGRAPIEDVQPALVLPSMSEAVPTPEAEVPATGRGISSKTSARRMAADLGQKIGLYELEAVIGQGGMGKVFKAWHPFDRRSVALKVILGAADDESKQMRELFLREATVLKAIDHPNVVRCYEVNEALLDGKPILFMAMELLEGRPLDKVLAAGPLPVDEAIRISKSIASALAALHSHVPQILHRDLKPPNVFVGQEGTTKLLDFGLAALADWRMTKLSEFASGSRPYMSPEQFGGLKKCTPRSDLYSLGITMHQMVTGRLPFEADTDIAFFYKHNHESPPRFAESLQNLSTARDPRIDSLQNIVTRLLAKKPTQRYASAQDVVAALEVLEVGGTISRPHVTRPERARLVRRLLLGGATAFVLAGAVLGGAQLMRSRVPAKLAQARAALERLDLEEAESLVHEARSLDRQNPSALELEGVVGNLFRGREAFLHRRELAASLAGERKWPEAIAAWGDAARLASKDGQPVARQDELQAIRGSIEATEKRRQGEVALAFARIEELLVAGRASESVPLLDRVEAIAAGEDEGHKLSELKVACSDQADLAAAEDALDAGQLNAAKVLGAAVDTRGVPASQAGRRQAVAARTARTSEIRARLALADAAARDGRFGEAATELGSLMEQVGQDPSHAGALLGRSLADLAAAEERAHFEIVLARGLAAEADGRAADALALFATARPLAANVPEERARALAEGEARVRASVHDSALVRARALHHQEGRSAEVQAAALEALVNVPRGATAELRRLAKRVAGESTGIAREQLRDGVRRIDGAEEAYLLLEDATASRACPAGFRFVPRQEGITLGSDSSEQENPLHRVDLAPFYIAINEATNGDFLALASVAGIGSFAPTGWNGAQIPPGRELLPLRGLSFDDATRVARLAGRRLPSADEWELAASVPPGRKSPRAYPWGDAFQPGIAPLGLREPRPVGALELDTSAWGCRDCGGNVQEWTWESAADGSATPVLKGGSYKLGRYPEEFRSELRTHPDPIRFEDAGARLAADPPLPDLGPLGAGE